MAILRFPYAGNGGTQAEVPDIADWLMSLVLQMKDDPRIGQVFPWRKADTPIDMVRNDSILEAKRAGADLALMIDSDMDPDHELKLGDPLAKPFWKTSFDFLYERYLKRLLTVVAAPYCGPPPVENVYIFRWANYQSLHPNADLRIEQFSREEAASRAGFEEVAALPTGLILYDLRLFDLVPQPWFYYEYEGDGPPCSHCHQRKPGPHARKASTEDVTATRDFVLHAHAALGYNPLFVNWDAWAGHWKPKCVGKPRLITTDQIGRKYMDAIRRDRPAFQQFVPNFRAADRPPATNLVPAAANGQHPTPEGDCVGTPAA